MHTAASVTAEPHRRRDDGESGLMAVRVNQYFGSSYATALSSSDPFRVIGPNHSEQGQLARTHIQRAGGAIWTEPHATAHVGTSEAEVGPNGAGRAGRGPWGERIDVCIASHDPFTSSYADARALKKQKTPTGMRAHRHIQNLGCCLWTISAFTRNAVGLRVSLSWSRICHALLHIYCDYVLSWLRVSCDQVFPSERVRRDLATTISTHPDSL